MVLTFQTMSPCVMCFHSDGAKDCFLTTVQSFKATESLEAMIWGKLSRNSMLRFFFSIFSRLVATYGKNFSANDGFRSSTLKMTKLKLLSDLRVKNCRWMICFQVFVIIF